MIPRLPRGTNGLGKSFKGAALYYLHDKGALTNERVGAVELLNLGTQNPETAWKIMAATAIHQKELKQAAGIKNTGRKLTQPMFTYSLSWHPDEKPDIAHMMDTAKSSLAALGFTNHQAMIVQHLDEPHSHVHVMVNRVCPETGKAHTMKLPMKRLSKWAMEYEREHGIKVQKRFDNQQHRDNKQKLTYEQAIQSMLDSHKSGKEELAAQQALEAKELQNRFEGKSPDDKSYQAALQRLEKKHYRESQKQINGQLKERRELDKAHDKAKPVEWLQRGESKFKKGDKKDAPKPAETLKVVDPKADWDKRQQQDKPAIKGWVSGQLNEVAQEEEDKPQSLKARQDERYEQEREITQAQRMEAGNTPPLKKIRSRAAGAAARRKRHLRRRLKAAQRQRDRNAKQKKRQAEKQNALLLLMIRQQRRKASALSL